MLWQGVETGALDRCRLAAGPDGLRLSGTVLTAEQLARATATNLHGEFATVVSTAQLLSTPGAGTARESPA